MERKKFIKKGLIGLGAIAGMPTILTNCSSGGGPDGSTCEVSPSEVAGPFPIKMPADLVRENITSDRKGIEMMITLSIQNKDDDCNPLPGVWVDVWHCDNEGHYSEYENNGDFTQQSFLRGRQVTNDFGQVSFITIYPGWYPGRAPHIHVEVLDSNENSLLVTQIAFPDDVSEEVYATTDYKGSADTSNEADRTFRNSLDDLMGTVSGNPTGGYFLNHTLVVKG